MLEPGASLDDTALAEAYGISRPPLRDLLWQLAGASYVLLHENRGAQVAHLEWLMDRGEYCAQSMKERRETATLAREVTRGRCQLMVGTVAIRLEDSCAMAEHAARIGADAILVESPPYAVRTEQESALNAPAIERAADLPIM